MKYLTLLLLIPLFGMSKSPDTCNSYSFEEPIKREDNSLLLKKDIDYYTIYINGKPYRGGGKGITTLPAGSTSWTWFGGNCSDCIQMTTTDISGIEGRFSACAK